MNNEYEEFLSELNTYFFTSAQQMALWIGYGGKTTMPFSLFCEKKYGFKEMRNAEDMNKELPNYEYRIPIGNLPYNWCPFQDEIDSCIGNTHELFYQIKIEVLLEAKERLLKSADPRIGKEIQNV